MVLVLTTYGIFLLVVLMLTTTIFVAAVALRNNSIMDIFYGPTFTVAAGITIWVTESFSIASAIVVALTAVWSARLGLRILFKNWGKPEDARYARWRAQWSEHGALYVLLRSYLQVFVLQGFIISLVALPLILVIAHPFASIPLWSIIAGGLVWLIGLLYETTADWQLDAFISRKKAGTESANLMTTGLFRYSRRPNYFGETLIWWGLAIIILPLPLGYLGLVSPLVITFIVTRVTGPILEDFFLETYGAEYRSYMERTSYFIPFPPR